MLSTIFLLEVWGEKLQATILPMKKKTKKRLKCETEKQICSTTTVDLRLMDWITSHPHSVRTGDKSESEMIEETLLPAHKKKKRISTEKCDKNYWAAKEGLSLACRCDRLWQIRFWNCAAAQLLFVWLFSWTQMFGGSLQNELSDIWTARSLYCQSTATGSLKVGGICSPTTSLMHSRTMNRPGSLRSFEGSWSQTWMYLKAQKNP